MTEYVLGHEPAELERLVLQGRMYETATRELLERAGIGSGMRVLDVGCGTGDVSMLVAEYVGPDGRVVGVDRSSAALEASRRRALADGVAHAEFLRVDLEELRLDKPVDAVVGRFVLMHQARPHEFLRGLLRHVRPGGSVAFLESQMAASVAGMHSHPHSPTYDRINQLKIAAIEAVQAHNDMGFRLGTTFVEAGLPFPSLRLHAYQDGGPEAMIPRFAASSLKSMLPVLERHGVASLSEADVDALERTMVEELAATGGSLTSPLVVCACARWAG